jgi:hypothetical protein
LLSFLGSAAYSVKRNYVRLGLLAYECRFDRAGIDPRSVIELSEMPHTVTIEIIKRYLIIEFIGKKEKTWK